MGSYFGWVDYSEREKRLMGEVIDLFGEQDTRDELGIGVIRDALADLFFPGTSTLQTRARYFLFVPWMFTDLERKRVSSSVIAARARREEVRLIKGLLKRGEQLGVIGVAAGEHLLRMPSSIYWNGLGLWGIRRFPGAPADYGRSLDLYYRRASQALTGDGGEAVDLGMPNWDPGLPRAAEGFPDEVGLDLTEQEAAYLRDKLTGVGLDPFRQTSKIGRQCPERMSKHGEHGAGTTTTTVVHRAVQGRGRGPLPQQWEVDGRGRP